MELSFLRPLYVRPGPWATVYLDASRDTQDGAAAVDLRWRALADRLGAGGAPADVVDRLGAAVRDHEPRAGGYGLAGFAAADVDPVLHHLPAPPTRELAAVGPLPHVMPLLAQRGEDVAWLRVLADRIGADLDSVDAGGVHRHREVTGRESFPIRKVRVGGWSHRHFQQAAEEAWKHNAEDTSAAVVRLAETIGADVLVVAGDVRARELLLERLPARWRDRAVLTDAGSRAAGAAAQPLDEATVVAVAEAGDRLAAGALDRFGAQEGAGVGLAAVVAALQRAQVDTLLLVDDPSSTARLWIGPEANQLALDAAEVRGMGVDDPWEVRADAALVRALVGTDGSLVFVGPDQLDADDGVGAVLRWNDPVTRAEAGARSR